MERTSLISAIAFAREHSSIWRSLTPTGEIFIRRLNADVYERQYPPLKSVVEPARRAFVNELGFQLFFDAEDQKWAGEFFPGNAVRDAMASLQRASRRYRGAPGKVEADEQETREARELFGRLRAFFGRESQRQVLELFPRFPGCGILDSCAGDIYFPTTLFEVKAGDRSFLSVDVRQLLIYAALNKSAGVRELTRVGLFNPRTGTSFVADLDELSREISGVPSGDLLAEIIRIASSGDVSR